MDDLEFDSRHCTTFNDSGQLFTRVSISKLYNLVMATGR